MAMPTVPQVASVRSWSAPKLAERGDATWYNPSDPVQNHGWVNMGSCGPVHDYDMMVALSPAHGKPCGACVSIRANGNCVNAIVQDTCAGCSPEHIDLTPAVWTQLAPLEVGKMKVDWDFSCSCTGAPVAAAPAVGQCTQSNDFAQCESGCCFEGQCSAREVCFGH